ncbi:hypothetical protein PENTCL1PPCAC_13381, partial [Pristionchus entomophagus]
DEEPSVKKLRADSEKSCGNATPQCILCEAHPSMVSGYTVHLFKHHKSTLIANYIYLLCSCGFEIRSCYSTTKHSKCDSRHFFLRKNEVKTTPQCILCEMYPSTLRGFTDHLYTHHKSTLIANGIYLLCSCGMKVRSTYINPNHSKECDYLHFTLHKLDEKIQSTPQ